jgi:RNA polymerase sigma-70 factor (ECF subfamily)
MHDELTFSNLIQRVREGDELAATKLVQRYEAEIRREVRARLRFRDPRLRRSFDSMDIVQSVLQSFFVRVALGQYDLDEPSQLCALLMSMARNKLAEHVRFEHRERRDVRRVEEGIITELPQAADDPSPSRVIAGKDLLHEFRHRLTAEERELADLRAEGRTWAELAVKLGGTPEARRKQLSRAVDRVALELGLRD